MPELLRLYFGLPEAQVLGYRDTALALIGEGKTLMNVGAGGKTGQKEFALPPATVVFEANAALRKINPAVYGRRIRKTYSCVRNRFD